MPQPDPACVRPLLTVLDSVLDATAGVLVTVHDDDDEPWADDRAAATATLAAAIVTLADVLRRLLREYRDLAQRT